MKLIALFCPVNSFRDRYTTTLISLSNQRAPMNPCRTTKFLLGNTNYSFVLHGDQYKDIGYQSYSTRSHKNPLSNWKIEEPGIVWSILQTNYNVNE